MAIALCCIGFAANAAPEDAEVHYKAAMERMQAGDFKNAGASFWAAYQADPSAPLLWNAARAYHKGGELTRARELYQRFLEVEKQSDPRWKKALELSKEVTRELENQAVLKAKTEKENREALEREITDKVTQKILSQLETKTEKEDATTTLRQVEESEDLRTEGWITFGVGAAIGVGSLTLMLLADDAQSQANNPSLDTNGIVRVHTQVEAAEFQRDADDLKLGALVTGLIGGGAIITGLVLAFVTGEDHSVGFAPTQGGASFAFGGSF